MQIVTLLMMIKVLKIKGALQHALVPWAEHMVLTKIVKLLFKDMRDLHSLPMFQFFTGCFLMYLGRYHFVVGLIFYHCNLVTKDMVGAGERFFDIRDLLRVKLMAFFIWGRLISQPKIIPLFTHFNQFAPTLGISNFYNSFSSFPWGH